MISSAVLSSEDQKILENLEDARYFTETFLHIIDKDRKKVPFLFNPPQNKYYDNKTHFDLILKARKEGFSSLIEALFLHACLFGENVRAVILSHEMESTERHFDRVRFYLDTMGFKDTKFVVDLDKDSSRQLVFPQTNSSYWIGTAGSRSFGRGDDITHLHLSEVAHYQHQEVLTSALEACVPNAYRVMETTANGVGELFYRLWKEASDPHSGSPWKPHFFSWFEDPTNSLDVPLNFRLTDAERKLKNRYNLKDQQIAWYRSKRAGMADKSLLPQEYPSDAEEAFISSGRHVFNLEKLKIMRERLKIAVKPRVGDVVEDGQKVKFLDNDEGFTKVWKMPNHTRKYLISADVAEGVPNGNWSVAPVYDRSSWEVVATVRRRVSPGEWGRQLVEVARFYNNAILSPENNSLGQGTIEAIKETEYPHLLNTHDLWGEKETVKDGFPTNEKTRNLAISALRTMIDEETIVLWDSVFINELETFVVDDTGKFVAMEGCQDDCVLSLAIGAYCLKYLTVDETYAAHNKIETSRMRFNEAKEKQSEGRRKATGW